MRLGLACCVAVVALLAATTETAHACSCALPDARGLLVGADGAFVGTLERRRDVGGGQASFTFRVERSVKGGLGSTVEVETAASGSMCGLEVSVGERIGLFLDRRAGRWTSGLCWRVDPDELLAAARPLPRPDGRGRPVLLVGTQLGPVRMLALDDRGRTLAYGRGQGRVVLISLCPGGMRSAEAVALDTGYAVAIRELPTLRLVRQRRLALPPETAPTSLRCESTDGSKLLAFHSSADRAAGARLERLTAGRAAVVWRGVAIGATLTDRVAFVIAGRDGSRLLSVDLRSARVRSVGRIPSMFSQVVVDPTATHLAGIGSWPGSRRIVVSIRLRPFAVVTRRLVEPGDVAWIDARRFVIFPNGLRARVYSRGLGLIASFPWRAYRGTVVAGMAYGIDFDGRLHRAELPSGPARVGRRGPSRVVDVIAAVPR